MMPIIATGAAMLLLAGSPALAGDPLCIGASHVACDEQWTNAEDYFGEPAISGPWAILGKRGDNEAATDAGAVYFYRLVNGRWQHLVKIPHPDPAPQEWLGESVAIDGDIAVASAPGWEVNTGRLLVFEYDETAGEWDWVDELFIEEGQQGDGLGGGAGLLWRNGVAVSRSIIAGGAPGATLPDPGDPQNELGGAGIVAVFQGGQETVIDSSDFGLTPVQGGNFGAAVVLDDNRIAIGEPGRDNTGRVYVARNEAGQWIPEAVLSSPDPHGGAFFNFGFTLALEGDTLLVGAPNEDAVHFFEYDDVLETWAYSGVTLENPAAFASGTYGMSVAMSGSLVLIGGTFEAVGQDVWQAADLYQRDSQGQWQLAQTFAPSEPDSAGFALGVALSSDGAIIADLAEDVDDGQSGSITDAGAVYFFRNLPSCDEYDPACTN